MAAHQAPPSLGFSRQEHWSGLPFPSPMQKVKSESEASQSCLILSDPMDCSLPGSPSMGFSRREYWSGCHCLLPPFCRRLCKLCSQSLVRHFSHDSPRAGSQRAILSHRTHNIQVTISPLLPRQQVRASVSVWLGLFKLHTTQTYLNTCIVI